MIQATMCYINRLGDIVYECPICNQEFEFEHDKPYKLTGIITNYKGSFKHLVEVEICEECAVTIGQIDEV